MSQSDPTRPDGATILIPISPGELLDRLSILDLKLRLITDPAKQANVAREHAMLLQIRNETIPTDGDVILEAARLAEVNRQLWIVEDDLRDLERQSRFDADFIALARSVYRLNDARADAKKRINLILGSTIVEEKSYADYLAPSPPPSGTSGTATPVEAT